ncbi:GNAT family N-acetyltransferase [Consotaella aegiceratis]|uniref:GNAT family N-acetyltransferase n=1 Tax=Consotaella aegiceratis TaxID=3097961 RepID=UPI002F42FB0E
MTNDLSAWQPRALPGRVALEGRSVLVEPVGDERRFGQLYDVVAGADDALWRWMGYGPFANGQALETVLRRLAFDSAMVLHAVVPKSSGRAEGWMALMRIDAANGVIEIGNVVLGPRLQRTREATEAFFLLMGRVFDELDYRRLEWKCDATNGPSRRAAERLGFTYEGTFRQHMVVKGRNRDTAWFAMTDDEWPRRRSAFEAWLDTGNFDDRGRQRQSLDAFR